MAKPEKQSRKGKGRKPKPDEPGYWTWVHENRRREEKLRGLRPRRPGDPSRDKRRQPGRKLMPLSVVRTQRLNVLFSAPAMKGLRALARKLGKVERSTITPAAAAYELILLALALPNVVKRVSKARKKRQEPKKPGEAPPKRG